MSRSDLSRRAFVGRLATAGAGAALAPRAFGATTLPADGPFPSPQASRFVLCVFSKHLQFLGYEAMAALAAEVGFEGVDLTVRPDGHVTPENVARDLPLAVKAVREAGLAVPTITTDITSVDQPNARTILEVAADQGIPGYRMGWLSYDPELGVEGTLEALKPKMAALAALNEELGLHGDYQNHEGTYVGSAVWDIATLLDGIDPAWLGVQYDIRHATVEGAHTWPLGLELLAPRIQSLVIKDFRWAPSESEVRIENVPLGRGVVDFPAFWREIKRLGIRRPISLHFEYPMPGHPEPLDPETLRTQTIEVMRRDLAMLRKMLVQAALG